MRKTIYTLLLTGGVALFSACQSQEEKPTDIDRELVWSDEFEKSGKPDTNKWGYDLGDGCPTLCGWGNNELQVYTDEESNARIEDGRLIIEARKNRKDSVRKYTSARLITKHKGDWKYGYVEVKAKLPEGKGTWPAIWMLPTDWKYGDWPGSGEIDIMEHVGYDQGNVHGTVHTEAFNHVKGTQKGDSIVLETVSDQFHTYAINWTPDQIEFLVDNEVYNTFSNNGNGHKAWPFDQPFHLILNIAVGGNWGGRNGIDESIWPQRMEVDYVRIYKNNQETIAKK